MDDAKQVGEEKREDRHAAEQAFARSLTQLEDLLLIEADSHTIKVNSVIDSTQNEPQNRFGGSLFDAIPLVHQLANRLGNLPESNHLAHPDKSKTAD